MRNRRNLDVVIFLMIIFSFTIIAGCAKPPTEEMAKAEKVLEEAKQKEAPAYVPDLYNKAEESLKKAKAYITEKKYKEAKPIAIETERFGRQAIAGIEAAKAKMKTEAEQTVQDVQKGIDDLKGLVAGAEKKKAIAAAREEIQGIITKWETDLATVKEKLMNKTKDASEELKALKEQVEKKKEEAVSLLTAPSASSAKKKK